MMMMMMKCQMAGRYLAQLYECCTDWQKVEAHCGNNRPLNDRQLSVIDANRHTLMKEIDVNQKLLERLCAISCINDFHKQSIESRPTMFERARKLLDIVRYRSVENFNMLVVELKKDGQQKVARLLEGGGNIDSSAITIVLLYN